MTPESTLPEEPAPDVEAQERRGERLPYEAPRVQSVRLSDEAAESLT